MRLRVQLNRFGEDSWGELELHIGMGDNNRMGEVCVGLLKGGEHVFDRVVFAVHNFVVAVVWLFVHQLVMYICVKASICAIWTELS